MKRQARKPAKPPTKVRNNPVGSEMSYREIFESASDAILVHDAVTGKIIDVNKAVLEMFKSRSKQDVLARNVAGLSANEPPFTDKEALQRIRLAASGTPQVFKWLAKKRDGTLFWVEVSLRSAKIGRKKLVLAVARDISERKRTEEALRESESQQRELWDATVEGIVIHDQGIILELNNAMCQMFGVTRDQVIGKSIFPFVPEEASDRIQAHISSGLQVRFETPALRSDGTKLTLEVFAKTMLYRGKTVRMVTSRDITERKLAEQALQESEERFRSIVDTTAEWIWEMDLNGRHTFSNPGVTSILGYRPEEIIGSTATSLLHPEDRAEVEPVLRRLIAEKRGWRGWTLRWRHKDGSYRFLESNADPILDSNGTLAGYRGSDRDISERKHAEEALRVNEKRFRALIEHSHDAITMLSADGTVLYDSPSIASVLGYDPAERLGRPVHDFVYLEDRQKMADGLARFAQQAGAVAVSEARFVHKDGAPRWIEGVRTNLLHEPSIKCIVVNYRDITERRRAEEALANERALLRTVIDHIPDPIYVKDLEGRKTMANSAEARFCGKERVDEILGLTDTELFPPDVAEHSRKEEERLLRSASGFTKYEGKFVLADGTERWMIGSKITLKDTKGTPIGILGVSHDITERRLMEEERQKLDHQIQQSQRLESLGLLAGGIAHDFNNLLSGIFGYVELSKKNVDARQYDQASERLSKALNVFARARDLSRQLITFSKGGAPAKTAGDIGRTLSETVQFALSGSNVKSEYSIASDIWPCEYDPNQVSQVIDNIVINAKHAMPNGGVLEVSASNVMIESGSGVALPDGNFIRISIRDHGIGIPKEYLQKIFDPFFTTKHSGSGLGLATCWSIVKRHDGTILVESEPGKGSAFHVYLPAAHNTVSSAGRASSTRFVGHGKVLVMDDEEHIREILEEMLTDLGYTVETASNGAEAVEAYRNAAAGGKPFDIVMVDLTIPGGMGGKETLTKLVELEKNVCVIASSGYSEDPVISRPRDFGFASSIRKPYRKSELVEAIVHALSIRKA